MTELSVRNLVDTSLVSHKTKPIPKTLLPLSAALDNASIRYIFRWSRRGVPHLVLTVKGRASICWFGRDKFFRVFHPYPGNSVRQDFGTVEGALEYVKEQFK